MMEVKAIIADDEEPLRHSLKAMLSDLWPRLIVCGEAKNGREALALIEEHKPDVVFLDIRMPGLTGMDVARKIGAACWVVFVTAYDQYAVEAFENEAVDYLLKPVTPERLEKTVRRIEDKITAHETPPAYASLQADVMCGGD